MTPIMKPGKHGTLYLYELVYDDGPDSGCPEFKTRTWAYNMEHAIERFHESDGSWRLIKIARVLEGGFADRKNWHQVDW